MALRSLLLRYPLSTGALEAAAGDLEWTQRPKWSQGDAASAERLVRTWRDSQDAAAASADSTLRTR